MVAKAKFSRRLLILYLANPCDIFLRRKEYRTFRKRGSASTAVSILKHPEYDYYQPLKSCVPGKNIGQEIWAEASKESNLSKKTQRTHLERVWPSRLESELLFAGAVKLSYN